VSQAEERERLARQEQEFRVMVDEVCDEYTDYNNVLKRIQYLEKYRAEYYFNIEKIQLLCRMLDQ
jgi:predicted patatin/cPLA2 family phospholipase